ncbi:MAG TPA: glycosyltransferase [Chthoniobacter sp.]
MQPLFAPPDSLFSKSSRPSFAIADTLVFSQIPAEVSTITVEQALQLAMAWDRAGQFAISEPIYRQVLAAQPNHLEALHRLAAAYRQLGRSEDALACEKRALVLGQPQSPSQNPRTARRLCCPAPPPLASGWGVCMKQLVHHLSAWVDVVLQDSSKNPITFFDGPVFMPLNDHEFNPFQPVRGTRNFGYTFFEFALEPKSVSNAARFDSVFCGSTWCLDRMRDRGIHNGKVLVQGVDHSLFHPQSPAAQPADGQLRIFTGGKFEFRKGQDVVIAAFREILSRFPRARLVCAWHNLWPALIGGMKRSPHVVLPTGEFENQTRLYREILLLNGIPEANFEILPLMSQTEIADAMRSTDLGVFTNRCEGGTNLVLMEYLACGRPAVVTASTGHADVVAPAYALTLPPHLTPEFWDEPNVAEVAAAITQLGESSSLRATLGAAAGEAMRPYTWERAARTIMETIFPAEE